MKTFKYERVIPTPMAKGSGKGKKSDKPKKGDKSQKADASKKGGKPKKDAVKRSRYSPIRTKVHESGIKEVTALQAFLTSFIFLSLILAPVLGLGLYFAWNIVVDYFSTPEMAFMSGMGIGLTLSFVIALLFTRKAVATA
jgi:hypothetical protein